MTIRIPKGNTVFWVVEKGHFAEKRLTVEKLLVRLLLMKSLSAFAEKPTMEGECFMLRHEHSLFKNSLQMMVGGLCKVTKNLKQKIQELNRESIQNVVLKMTEFLSKEQYDRLEELIDAQKAEMQRWK